MMDITLQAVFPGTSREPRPAGAGGWNGIFLKGEEGHSWQQ